MSLKHCEFKVSTKVLHKIAGTGAYISVQQRRVKTVYEHISNDLAFIINYCGEINTYFCISTLFLIYYEGTAIYVITQVTITRF